MNDNNNSKTRITDGGCRLKATMGRTDGGVWVVPANEEASLFLPSAQIVSFYQP